MVRLQSRHADRTSAARSAREEEPAAVEAADREKVDLDRGDDPEIGLAAAHRPEQVGVAVRGDAAQPAVGGDQLDGVDVVGGEPVLAGQQGDTAAGCVADRPDAGRGPVQRCEATLRRLRHNLPPADARADPRRPRRGVDADLAQPPGVHQNAVDQYRGSVPGEVRPQRHVVLGGEADRGLHVGGACRADDEGRVVLEGQVEAGALVAVARGARGQDGTGCRTGELVDVPGRKRRCGHEASSLAGPRQR